MMRPGLARSLRSQERALLWQLGPHGNLAPPCGICEVTWADMEAAAQGRSSLPEVLLQVARLLALLVQNRMHLYRLLLLKTALFRGWVVGLSQEARGPCCSPTRRPPQGSSWAPGWALRVGRALLLCGPRLARAAGLGCARASLLAVRRLSVCEWLGLCVAAWRSLLWSCLHGLMLVASLSLLLAWKLFRKSQHFLGWLPHQALLGSRMVLQLLALLRCPCWHLAYLVTWTTCLASHLLQAAFEHTSRLARAQEGSPFPTSSSSLEAWPVAQEPGSSGQ